MANFASLMKAEVARIARKELRAEVDTLRKGLAAQRSENVALKKRLGEVERLVAKLAKSAESAEGISARTNARSTAGPISSESMPTDKGTRAAFSASGFRALRKHLGLSAEDMGLLVGASGQSVYKWETKGVMPRAKQLEGIWSIKDINKADAAQRLAKLKA